MALLMLKTTTPLLDFLVSSALATELVRHDRKHSLRVCLDSQIGAGQIRINRIGHRGMVSQLLQSLNVKSHIISQKTLFETSSFKRKKITIITLLFPSKGVGESFLSFFNCSKQHSIFVLLYRTLKNKALLFPLSPLFHWGAGGKFRFPKIVRHLKQSA